MARWYDPALARFVQADTMVPDPGKSHSFDRYAYANNNPVLYNDPSGHDVDCGAYDAACRQQVKTEKLYAQTMEEKYGSDWFFWSLYQDPIKEQSIKNYHNFGDYRGLHDSEDQWHGEKEWHASIDVGGNNNKGVAIYTVLPGEVISAGWDYGGFGNYVVIESIVNMKRYYSVYGHLGSDKADDTGITVNVGEYVGYDTQIGKMGNSFYTHATGCKNDCIDTHLHFEIRWDTNVDLTKTNPLNGKRYWAYEGERWWDYFLDLGIKYGYKTNVKENEFPMPPKETK